MAFRERVAWLTLGALVVMYGLYFGVVGPAAGFGARSMLDIVWSFGPLAAAHAAVMAVGAAALALAARNEAKAPPDERDRALDRRGSQVGYYVLLAGLVLVGVVMPFSEPPWKIVNTGLLVVVLAEVARHVVILGGYRLGRNG